MNLEQLCKDACDLVKTTGAFILKERLTFSSESIEHKGHNDMVSYVDKTAEKLLVEGLLKLLPEGGFITEEKTVNITGKEYNWIIDPLDGTTNFIHGLPCFCISVALTAPLPPEGGIASNEEHNYGYETADPVLYGLLKEFVRQSRSVPTEAENVFWQLVRGKKLEGYKFRRQHILGSYIADFVCLKEKLVIEIDGLIHQLPENKESDDQRTQWLNEKGFKVIRFTNEEVIGNAEDVLSKVLSELPIPPSGGGGARSGNVVLGIIYEINQDELFYGWLGGGAYLNGKPISVSKVARVKDSLLATGFPYTDYTYMKQYMAIFDYCMHHTHGLRRLGSAAADLAYVACGRLEGFYEYGLQSWDVAAGVLLVTEAGGTVSDFKGGNNYVFGKELIACNALIHQEFYEVVRTEFERLP